MTYGIPHTVRGWDPNDIVTTVDIDDPRELGETYTAVVRGTVPGPVILVPTVALTPVDTTPAEPEPGAWLVGETVVMRLARPCSRPWFRETKQGSSFDDWADTWKAVGGPGITPRRLVPMLEPVELPWDPHPLNVNDLGKTRTSVRVDGYYVQDENVVGRVGNVVTMLPDEAEEKAAALLAAARAAREVKP